MIIIMKNTRAIINNKIKVLNNNCKASFFFPSKYQIIGRPKTKLPVNAAEKTKSMSIAIGINTVLLSGNPLFPKK